MSSQYMNTMVFAVVAGVISLLLLLLIMRASDTVRQYSAFVITLEIGLVIIICTAVYRIISFERAQLAAQKAGFTTTMPVSTCPDYWTRGGGDVCVNTFNADPRYSYRMTGVDANTAQVQIKLGDYDGRSIADVCSRVKANVKAPWTDVKSVCSSYRLSA